MNWLNSTNAKEIGNLSQSSDVGLNSELLLIKYIAIFVIVLYILYNLHSVYILTNITDKDLVIINYLPRKIKNHINWLKKIKNSSSLVGEIYLQIYLTNAKYMVVLLLLFLTITSLFEILKF